MLPNQTLQTYIIMLFQDTLTLSCPVVRRWLSRATEFPWVQLSPKHNTVVNAIANVLLECCSSKIIIIPRCLSLKFILCLFRLSSRPFGLLHPRIFRTYPSKFERASRPNGLLFITFRLAKNLQKIFKRKEEP